MAWGVTHTLPLQSFALVRGFERAFRLLLSGANTGKVVLRVASEASRGGGTELLTGGTGITGRDVTPEAVMPLLDKVLEGFGELFRQLSFAEIGASTIQSRALAGVANATLVFCLPGSSGAVRLGWQQILQPQLDMRTKPCNFAMLLPRLSEHA